MNRIALLGLLAALSASVQAGQEPPVWRLGAAASFADFDWTAGSVDVVEDSAVGAKVFAQYKFNNWIGIEGAYHNTGDFKETLANGTADYPAGDYELSFDGFSAAAMFFLPAPSEELEFYLKAGLFNFDDQLGLNGVTTSSSSEDGLMAGGGVGIEISDRFGIRADLDWFNTDVGDLWAVNLGLQYAFGGRSEPVDTPAPPPAPAAAPVADEAAPPPPPPPPADTDGDGVTDDADKCPGTPSGAKVDAEGCEQEVTLQGVNFETNSAELTGESLAILDSAAALIKQRPSFNVLVGGHTDSSGADAYNQDLSQRRAQSVVDYLVSQGVDAGKLSANGYGETQPVAGNDTADGRAQNRRVTLEFSAAAK